MTITNLEQFTDKSKPIIYRGVFVKLYNWRNHKQVFEIYGMIELKKMHASTGKYHCNFNVHYIVAISSILRNEHVVPRD